MIISNQDNILYNIDNEVKKNNWYTFITNFYQISFNLTRYYFNTIPLYLENLYKSYSIKQRKITNKYYTIIFD